MGRDQRGKNSGRQCGHVGCGRGRNAKAANQSFWVSPIFPRTRANLKIPENDHVYETGNARGNSSDYEAVCGSTAVLLILPAAEFRGGIAFRFGFRRLFELPTLGSLPTAGIFLCVVSGVHPTGPRSLIRLTDLVDQLEFRAARGAKAEAEGKSYSRFKYRLMTRAGSSGWAAEFVPAVASSIHDSSRHGR